MISSRSVFLRLKFVIVVLVAGAFTAAGQMTVINTPSTDTLQAKMFYIESILPQSLKSTVTVVFRHTATARFTE